jgi:hypothetical protein
MNSTCRAVLACGLAVLFATTAEAAPKKKPAASRAPKASKKIGTTAAQGPIDPPNDPRPVHSVRTPPLRNMPPLPPPARGEEMGRERVPEPIRPTPPIDNGEPDTVRQSSFGPLVSAPTAGGISFEGVGVGIPGFVPSSNPPDTNGRVGATQYVQWNNTSFAVWDKSGTLLYGPAAGNTLFQPLGGACASHNDGDPVVAYDILAGRWILSLFVVGASPSFSHQCVAVSQTQDATGSYYLYDFVTDATNFVDYPHIGVWPDGYYMSAHVFNPAGTSFLAGRVYVFERTQMIQGLPARMVSANLPTIGGPSGIQYGFLPADLDSATPPPAGEAQFLVGPDPALLTRIASTRVAVTWGATPSISPLSTTRVTISSAGNAPCATTDSTNFPSSCVPQPSPATGTEYLDNLSFHFMYRLPYRNFGGTPVQESLVANVTANGTTGGTAHDAIRWYELRNAGSSTSAPSVFQYGTYDPDGSWRFMGSIAMDKDHNIALGYSKSSTSIKPGIYITGRLAGDASGTMGAETTVQAGGGVQTADGGNRWGDYSAMTLDPIDQCTFWYTNEYLQSDGAYNWATRIATYRFPSCTSASSWGTVEGTITSCATGAPLAGVLVTLSNGFAGASDATGHYSISVPAGSYTATSASTDRNCASSTPASASVSVSSAGTTTQNFCMTGSSNLQYNSLAVDDSAAGNGNGIVNANECFSLNVGVRNHGCANETAIAATLTTSTAGVTVTQGTASYSDLAIDASAVNSSPFQVQTSNSFVCGTQISFTLNLTYASGNKSIGFTLPTCSGGPDQTIATSSIALADASQTDRLGRDGVPSTCEGKGCPGGIATAGTRNYKTFNFTNAGGAPACITVTVNAACGSGGTAGDISSAAYLTTYNPANLCTNYLGDSGVVGLGTTVPSASYSFNVPAGANFVVVVNTNTGGTTCQQFSGLVSGFFDFTPGPGACATCTPPATPTISAGGPTTFCSGNSVTLTSSSGTAYQWYRNDVLLNGSTSQSLIVTTSGSYTVTITDGSGCTSAASAPTVVTVNAVPSTPTASNTGPYCAGATISLSTPTVTGATYAWTGPNGFTSALRTPTRTNATTADAGTYSVTVTVNGCTSAAGTTNVVVNPIPATPTASNAGPYCAGATISLSTPTVSGATYAWTGPNGFTSALQNPTRTNATTADAGTYSVTVTVSGCTSAAGTTSVVVNPAPATPTASNTGPYCAGATISLSTPTVGGATYAWTGPNGFTSALQNPTRTNATTADGGTYSVTITVNGCTSAAGSTSVVVNAIPTTPTASNTGPYCEGATISLSTPTVSGATYAWTGPNGFTSALRTPTRTNATTADAGAYSVTVTVNGCTSAAGSTNVVVNAIPATPTASNTGPYCAGATISLSTPTVSGATYAWTGPNGFTSALQNPTRTNATTADAGSYSVTITVNGCTSAAGSTSVVVNALPATPTASNTGPYCAGGTISLSTPTVGGATYAWTGPNGFTSALQNPTRTNATTADGGTYSVTITVNGCTSAAGSTSVVVNAIPATPTASNTGPYCAGGTISLSTPTVSGATYSWTGPNGFTSALRTPTRSNATTADAGTYSVTVTVNGCTSSAGSTTVVVNPLPTPTITPNGATTFCNGSSVTLTSSSATGNQWYRDNNLLSGATAQQYVATITGDYTVRVTDGNGCTGSSAATTVTVTALSVTPATIPAGGFGTPYGPITFAASGGSGTVSFGQTGALPAGMSFTSGTLSGTPSQSGSFPITVTATDSNGCTGSTNYTLLIVAVPSNVLATATSGTQVSVTWTAVTGATSYEVTRNGSSLGTTPSASFTDTTATAATTYFYRVRALTASSPTLYSAADMATTVAFTDNPIVAGVTVI